MRKYEKGYALVLSIILIDVLVVMTFFMANKISREAHNTTREESTIKAQYYAEAALEYAAANINNDDIWSHAESENNKRTMKNNEKKNLVDNFLSPEGASIGNIKREIDGSDVTIIIENLEYRNRVKNLEVTFEKTSSGSGSGDGIFDNPMNAGGTINVHEGSVVDIDQTKNVFAGGDINDNTSEEKPEGDIPDKNEVSYNMSTEEDKENIENKELKQIEDMGKLCDDVTNYCNNLRSSGTKSWPSEFGDPPRQIEGEFNLYIQEGEIWDLRGFTYNNATINIYGEGVILVNDASAQNGGIMNINYDPVSGEFVGDTYIDPAGKSWNTSGLSILSETNMPLKYVNMKGLFYAKGDISNNEHLNVQGVIVADGNHQTGPIFYKTRHDKEFYPPFIETLESNGIEVPESIKGEGGGEDENPSAIGHTLKRWQEY